MRKILIATHGKLADGFKSSLSILLGNKDIKTINAYIENQKENFLIDIKHFIDDLDINDEGVIFTDIYGGSVNQKVVEQVSKANKKIFVITQTNLAIIIQILLDNNNLSDSLIDKYISESVPKLVKINNIDQDSKQDDDEFFRD